MDKQSKENIEWIVSAGIVLALFFGTIGLAGMFAGVNWLELIPHYSGEFVNIDVFKDLINFREN
ncbi:hypothetical protein [Halobacillus sp. A5]|uniref:hypothetical protein n=1 Tax=Halobacillus sp. A5 TaxID=2880263 RepID=UPI0020A6B7B1|nr:hypothetical protein [Halobacillus sp. A5]